MIDIEQAVEQSGLTLQELASRTSIPRKRLEAILSGRWLPSPADRQRIADVLGRDVNGISWGHTMNPRNVRYHRFGLPEDF